MKRLAARLALALAATLLALLALDRAVALIDPWGIGNLARNSRYFAAAVQGVPGPDGGLPADGRLFEHRPGLDLDFGPFTLRTDARGLRVGASPAGTDTDADALRVLCLGDSITFGWGVDDEVTWLRVLERERRAADGRPLRCLNAGHLMYDTVQEADWFRAHGKALEPDLVLLSFLSNDLASSHAAVLQRLAPEDADADTSHGGATGAGIIGWFDRASARWLPALRGLLAHSERRGLAERVARGQFPNLDETPGYPEGWPRCEAALDDIADRCEALGARLVLLQCFPPVVPELAAWCARRQLPLIDARFTPDEWARGLVNSASDPHPNARGNRLLADKIAAGLQDLELLAPADAPR